MKKIVDLMNLKGRRALITGAIGAIGQEIALTIAELGGDLVLTDMPGSDYLELIKSIKEISDVNVESFDCQLEDEESRNRLVSFIENGAKPLNVVINNAAFVGTSELSGWATDFENQTVKTWRRALEVNLTAVFDLCQGLSSKLIASKNGSIINMASIYGSNAPDYSLYKGTNMANPAAYAASKGGLIQLTRWLASTVAPDIRVNAISFGGVFRNQDKKFVERYVAQTPMDRMATEEDVKGIIAYLSSDLSKYVTGQDFIVDGGWSI